MPSVCSRIGRRVKSLYWLYTAPISVYFLTWLSFLLLLAVFSTMVLVSLDESSVGWMEYFVWIWMASLCLEEVRQINSLVQLTLRRRISCWFSDGWNKLDLLLSMLIIVSIVLRFLLKGNAFIYARSVYCVSVLVVYIRSMQFWLFFKQIGPKIIMIRKMLSDLFLFLCILLVFVVGYGVAIHALLEPNSPVSWDLLLKIVYKPYWQLHGELIDLKEGCSYNGADEGSDPNDPVCSRNPVVPALLAFYVLICNILLLNLLIAMFKYARGGREQTGRGSQPGRNWVVCCSYSFQKVQDNAEIVFRFYRYEMMFEYADKPPIVPPFVVLGLVYRTLVFMASPLRKKTGPLPRRSHFFRTHYNMEDEVAFRVLERNAAEKLQVTDLSQQDPI